ncbi:unnamed protein product, partial [Didymodactylos carnosus]
MANLNDEVDIYLADLFANERGEIDTFHMIQVVGDEISVWYQVGEFGDWVSTNELYFPTSNADDMRAFFTVNINHIKDITFEPKTQMWIHAIRFWSVVAGFVVTSKSKEYIIVDDPVAFHPSLDAFFQFAKRYHSNAWTAAAARTTSWRRSNHATGAEIATGFPKRWLMKEGYWDSDQGKATRIQEQKNATPAFYIAAHAVSVHSVLALMVPVTKVHWAYIDPSFGCITSWDVRASTTVRMVPNSQVAGTAIVMDS